MATEKDFDHVLKLCVIGDDGVGKETLLETLTGKRAFGFCVHEIQCCYGRTQLRIGVGDNDDFDDVRMTRHPNYYRKFQNLNGIMIVYDVRNRASFESIKYYAEEMEHYNYRLPPCLLIGNIPYREHERCVTTGDGQRKAETLSVLFREIAVKSEEDVQLIFKTLVEAALEARAEETGVPLELIPSPQSKLEKELEKKNTMEAMWYGITPTLLKRLKSTSASVNDILQHGVEENYHVRVMVVGKEGVGKSTLTRRLIQLPVDIRQYNSTDGIDVHIHTCEVDLDSGVWSHRDLGVFDKIKSVFGIQTKEKLRYVSPGGSRDFHQRLAQVLQSHTQAQTSNSDDLPTLIPSSNLKPFEDKETETDNKRNVKKEDYISKNRSSADSDQLSEATHQVITADDIEKTLRKAKTLKSERRGRKATISFYDFAGQEIFQASHPTFLSSKAIYILAFKLQNLWEMSRSLETSSPTEKTKLKEADSGKESIVFWLNVIYMFASIKTDIQPHVLLVGTHADKLPSKDRETIIKQCFDEFRNSIVDSPFNNILAKIEYAVDNTRKSNPVYSQLKNKIFELAKSLPNWGEKTPSKWLLLDREIQYLKESGHKVLSLKQLREINSGLEIGVSSDAEMTIFLQFLHDTGEIIYFSEEGLKDTIVLDPVWMIDALKTIITAERFSIRKPRLNVLWKDFRKSGVICKSAIVTIFEGNVSDRSLFENHEHMIRLMEKFLFIASPVSFPEDETTIGAIGGEEQADISYIMPCMVNKEADKDLITNEEGKSSTTVLCMIPATNFLPPAVFHKLLAMCITKWPIVEQRGQKLIFSGICKFNIDKYRLYKLTVFQVKYAVHAKIDSFVDDKQPDPAVCQPVMEFLTRSMTSVLQAMGFSAEFKTCIQCPQFSAAELGGYLDTDLTINQNYITCDDCSSSHALEKRDLLGCWIETEPKEKDELLSQASRDTFPADANADQENSAKTIRLEGPHDIELEHDDPLIDDAPITQEHLNHARLCNALVTVCADALREILLTQIPPGYPNFYQLLLAKEAALRGMRQFRQEQIGILYPDPHNRYPGTVDQFDITLLYALIRNVSAVVPPGTGWGQPPDDNPRDTSLGASVERIRRFRNTVVGHSVDYKVDLRTFEDTWNEIRQTIDDIENVIGDKGYEMALRERKNQAFTLEEARMLQRKFKDTLLSADESLEELQKTIDGIRKKIKTAVGEVC